MNRQIQKKIRNSLSIAGFSGMLAMVIFTADCAIQPTNQGSTTTGMAPVINYSGSPYSFVLYSAITTITPDLTGGTPTHCSSSPALPAGLSIDTVTCTISGTPTTVQSATSYTISASNNYGSGTANISITITTAELTGAPTSATSVAAGTELTVTVPVNSDTGFAVVALMPLNNSDVASAKTFNWVNLTPGANQNAIIKIGIPTNITLSSFYLLIDLTTTSADYSVNNFTRYYEGATGNTYLKKVVTSGVSNGFTDTLLNSMRLSVTAPGAVTATATACNTSTAAAVAAPLTVTTIPTAFTSATLVSSSCLFVLSMPEANTVYSISLDGISVGNDLRSYTDGTFLTMLGSSANAGTTPENLLVSSNSSKNIYIWVTNNSGASNFRLITP